jgi:multidrug efflux pump subunit AcrA (membrane-fusion protein)
VPSDQIRDVRPGAKVLFNVRGVDGDLVGRVDRLSASADPVTRQVSIFVTLPNTGGRLIAGLFAEGRVETATHDGVVVPIAAVDETGPTPLVTRIRNGKAELVTVTLGARQSETEQVEIASGISAGDVVVVGSAKGMPNGTPVQVMQ